MACAWNTHVLGVLLLELPAQRCTYSTVAPGILVKRKHTWVIWDALRVADALPTYELMTCMPAGLEVKLGSCFMHPIARQILKRCITTVFCRPCVRSMSSRNTAHHSPQMCLTLMHCRRRTMQVSWVVGPAVAPTPFDPEAVACAPGNRTRMQALPWQGCKGLFS